MPASQGVVNWPATGASASALVDPLMMPLPDASSTGCCWCTRSRRSRARASCCTRSGASSRPAGGSSWWRRTGAGSGRAWTRRLSATASPSAARSSKALMRQTWFSPEGWAETLYVPPLAQPLPAADRAGLGADRHRLLAALRGPARRRGDEAALPSRRGPGGPPLPPARAGFAPASGLRRRDRRTL